MESVQTTRNRRQVFRERMSTLEAASDPRTAISRGLYVPPPGRSVADQIAKRIELKPTSTHLVVGGVGAGKSTQLLMACQMLNEAADTRAIYVDVSARQRLDSLKPGTLVALCGQAIADEVPIPEPVRPSLHGPLQRLRELATGFYDPYPDADDEEGVWVSGVVTPAEPKLPWQVKALKEAVGEIRAAAPLPVTLVVDSLDRLTNLGAFTEVVVQDVAALRQLSIGLVLVGPIRVLHGLQRLTAEVFDYQYHLAVVNCRGKDGEAFLFNILRLRMPAEFIGDEECRSIVTWSGGVLRDLIALAQRAVEEAYLDGADQVGAPHVAAAADAFGRSLMLGLTSEDVEVLQRVRTKGVFIQSSEADLALLATRRVLEYRDPGQYAVHPTINGLLAELAAPF